MKIFTLILLICITTASHALAEPVKPLKVGDIVKELSFKEIVNSKKTSASLKDFKNKIIILDFWATWCSPCVAVLPKLDSLQRKYQNDIVVLPVTNENADIAKNFFKKRPTLQLPSVIDGSYLKEYFPHTLIPHTVVIDKNRKVVAITYSEDITASVIDSIVAGQSVHLRAKKDILKYNPSMPVMVPGNDEMNAPIAFRSLVLPSMPDMSSANATTEIDGQTVGFNTINAPIPHLFLEALERPWQYTYSRLIFENVRDSTRYRSNNPYDYSNSATEWARKNSYSFDLIAPGMSKQEQLSWMYQTLSNFFRRTDNLEVSLVHRPRPVMFLKKHHQQEPQPSTSPISLKVSYQDTDIKEWLKINTKDLAFNLECMIKKPVLDSSGIDFPVDFRIPPNVVRDTYYGDLTSLLELLNKAGFDLVPGNATIEAVLFKQY